MTLIDLSPLKNLLRIGNWFLDGNTIASIIVSDENMKALIKNTNPNILDTRFVIAPPPTNTPAPVPPTT